jgi:hypothetical protein
VICSQVLPEYFHSAPQCSEYWGTELKDLQKSQLWSSRCYNIKLLECANVGATGSIGSVSKRFPVHLIPGAVLFWSDYYNVYIK